MGVTVPASPTPASRSVGMSARAHCLEVGHKLLVGERHTQPSGDEHREGLVRGGTRLRR